MKHPTKLKIAGHDIEVIYKDQVIKDGDECLGYAEADNNRIYIKKGLEPSKFVEVLFHESLHIVDDNYRMNLEEQRVNTLGLELPRFIRDNKLWELFK